MFGWLLGNKCTFCRTKLPKGSSIAKQVKLADGGWKPCCAKCLSQLPGKHRIKNVIKQKEDHERRTEAKRTQSMHDRLSPGGGHG